jgi:ketosteroid isomerase-like protein
MVPYGTMTTPEETRKIVTSYFTAWTSKDVDAAYALLADDLHFAGPSASYETKAEFHPGLVGFAKMTKSARVVELLVDGNRASMLYDCELPDPVGTIKIASFFRVENGKIRWYETQFDATEFRKLLAAKP